MSGNRPIFYKGSTLIIPFVFLDENGVALTSAEVTVNNVWLYEGRSTTFNYPDKFLTGAWGEALYNGEAVDAFLVTAEPAQTSLLMAGPLDAAVQATTTADLVIKDRIEIATVAILRDTNSGGGIDNAVFLAGSAQVPTSITINASGGAVAFSEITGQPTDNTNLATALNGKLPIAQAIPISQVTGLQTALDGKLATGGTIASSQVTGLNASLATLTTAVNLRCLVILRDYTTVNSANSGSEQLVRRINLTTLPFSLEHTIRVMIELTAVATPGAVTVHLYLLPTGSGTFTVGNRVGTFLINGSATAGVSVSQIRNLPAGSSIVSNWNTRGNDSSSGSLTLGDLTQALDTAYDLVVTVTKGTASRACSYKSCTIELLP
jgi:hypothetical protein